MLNQTLSSRFDSEFFKKKYLKDDKSITKNGFNKLVNITHKINVGFVGAMVKHYRSEGVTILQTQNIDSFFIKDKNTIKITSEFHNKLSKSKVNKKNILIARSGSFGKASIYLNEKVINSSDIIIVEANEDKVNPYFLVSYLNSKFGINQMIRFASGGLQGHVNLTILEELEVPKIDILFQEKIEVLLELSYAKKSKAKSLYSQAENILLQEIRLDNFESSKESINVKSFSESFSITGRLDSEYYLPKYQEITDKITSQSSDKLINLVQITKSIEPGSKNYAEGGLPFMRVADFSKNGLTKPNKLLNKSFVKDNRKKITNLKPKAGTILFSKDGSVGTAYHLRQDFEGITSGAILHLKVKDASIVIPEYLTLVLNSKAVKMQAERDAGGSIILHWRISEIENVVVPIINYSIQKQIAILIEESFTLKRESESLLEVAKQAVEIAIEEDETSAIAFINESIEDEA